MVPQNVTSMLRKISEHLSFENFAYVAAVLVVPFTLVVVEYDLGQRWLLIALLFVILSMLTALIVDHRLVPAPYRKLRKKVSAASKKSKKHPILEKYYQDGILRTQNELENILDGRFSFIVSHVPEMSIFAMGLVDNRCILTFPLEQSEALLTPDSGPAYKYYLAMVNASERMQRMGVGRVTRIFILKPSEDISTKILNFIQKNIADGIDVRLLFEDELPALPANLESLDFGAPRRIAILQSVRPSPRHDGHFRFRFDADASPLLRWAPS